MCHEQDSDHQCAALHQRGQAPRQPRRLAPARGRARAFPPPGRRRGAVHLRHRRARHAGRARRARGRRRRAALLRRAARDPGGRLSPLRPVVRSFRPLVLPAEPCADPALLPPARRRRADRGARAATAVVAGRPALPDRYVLGTCPHCGFADARGDQCDGCGSLLDPPDLITPRSALSGDTGLELRETRHLFLRQSLLVDRLNVWLRTRSGWPPFVVSLARSWLTSDLRDRCITRDLAWGVPVPGFESKVFYVWFDAPIGYIAATQEWADEDPAQRRWQDSWQADDVRYIQFLGKDNVPFHAVSFPATLIGSGEPWKTVDVIKGFHWLNYEGGKFSTS